VSIYDDASKSEATLHEAMIAAEAGHDDVTAAKVAANLVYIVGYRFGRIPEAKFWADLGHAILDRVGGDQARIRSWLVGNLGGAHVRSGDFERARTLLEEAVVLKTHALGAEHPDLAAAYSDLAYVLTRLGRPTEALAAADRATAILLEHSDPNAYVLAYTYSNQGEALSALGRHVDAESAFKNALRLLAQNVGPKHPENAFALHGLGETRLAQRAPRAAVDLFEDALRIRRRPDEDPTLMADSEFGLARALWASGGDRTRARTLAAAALKTYREARRPEAWRAVEGWLVEHR
jgi:tetratricopeptide (TPR) repeat protein